MSAPARKPFLTLTITPVDVEVEGCTATILEASKLRLPWEEYQVSVRIKCGSVSSRVFQISYRSTEELKQKLVSETAKFKYLLLLYSAAELKALGVAA